MGVGSRLVASAEIVTRKIYDVLKYYT
jgi:hypothetical protein